MELGRRIKRNKLKWRLLDGSKEVVTDMYSSSKQTIDGIARSLFPVFAYRISLFVLAWLLLLSLCVLPLFTIGISLFGGIVDPFLLRSSYISVGVITLTWFFVARRFRYSVFIVFFYPLDCTCLTIFFVIIFRLFGIYIIMPANWVCRFIYICFSIICILIVRCFPTQFISCQ